MADHAKQPGIFVAFPLDGDILTHNDGIETDDALTITVRGEAFPCVQVMVNSVQAYADGGTFSCDVRLTRKRNVITVRAGDSVREIEVWWNRDSRKRFRFSIDDNIHFLKDIGLNPGNYPSIFDHGYMKFWRDMHKKYGAKFHFNIYYQTDDFDLTQMPGAWKDEWEANADWIHMTFHSLQDMPARPYRNAGYAQMAHDCDLVSGHIRRFAGNALVGSTTTVHWVICPREAVSALRDRGMDKLIGLFDSQDPNNPCTTGYYLTGDQYAHCDTRGAWRDRETGATFIRCTSVINNVALADIESWLNARTSTPQTAEMVELLIHEQYFRKELPSYAPDIFDRVEAALQWLKDRGYESVFWSDGFLGTPERPQ